MTSLYDYKVGPRIEILSDPDFDLHVDVREPEPGRFMPFIHLDVFYWSPSVIRKFDDIWSNVRPILSDILFCHGDVDDNKFHKFVSRYGFQPIGEAPCSDGVTRRIYMNMTTRNVSVPNQKVTN